MQMAPFHVASSRSQLSSSGCIGLPAGWGVTALVCMWQWLMTDPKSPISDFYPLNFALDAEGKRQDWEAVVVLKFIDVPLLRQAEGLVPADRLTPEERQRNQAGPLLHFFYDAGGCSARWQPTPLSYPRSCPPTVLQKLMLSTPPESSHARVRWFSAREPVCIAPAAHCKACYTVSCA